MPKSSKRQNEHSRVKVLRFPESKPAPTSNASGLDVLADAIRKAWTEKKSKTA